VWTRRPAQRDRAGRAEPFHLRGVDRGDGLGQGADRLRRGCAGQVDVLLDRARDAVQRAELGIVRHGPVGRVGGREGLLGQETDDGVELGVDCFDPVQVGLDDLTAADLPVPDHRRQLDSTFTPQFAHVCPLLVEIEVTVCHRIDRGKEGSCPAGLAVRTPARRS
jgi:hypothetical protein